MKLIYVMLAVSFLVMCETAPAEVTKPVEGLFDPPPPAPICIHKNCFERLSGMACDEGINWCRHYSAQYEHHCDCDQWAPAPQKDAH